ncbi:MAG: dienelactone hydrolase family protein [Candidatus Acidiferrales bacterium]
MAGLYWEPSKNLSPGVLLAPAPGEVKEGWIALATRLRQQGYGVLALDPRPRGANDAEPLLADLRAGVSFLRQQKKIDAARIGLIGSTRAANAALCFAAKEPLLRFAVAISPGLDGGDLAAEPALRDYGFRPLLLVAAENDQASRGAVERLAASAQAGAVAKIYPGNAHGTQLLGSGASLADDIVVFLRAQL